MDEQHDTPVHDRSCQFLLDLNELFADAVRIGGEPDVLERTLQAACRVAGGSRGFLALVDRHNGVLSIVCTFGGGWTDEARRLRLHLAQETNRGITGHVVLTGKPYLTGNVARDPHYLQFFHDAVSELAVPIMGTSGGALGAINIESTAPDAFTDAHSEAVTALAHAAAASIRVKGFREREDALIEIGANLASILDAHRLVQKVVSVAAEVLQFEDCSVFLVDEAGGHLTLEASRGVLASRVGVTAYRVGEGLTGYVASSGESVRVEDPIGDPRWLGRWIELPESEVGPLLAVPIVSRARVLGVLRVLRRRSHSRWFSVHFNEADQRVLMTIASQLGAALENARAHARLLEAERMAAWGEMSARSAHMIGNRTFALKGDLNELHFLLNDLPRSDLVEEVRSVALSMQNGVARLEEILREFRDFVMATKLALTDVDMNDLLRETVLETFPKRSVVALDLRLADAALPVQADAPRLRRAFSELIENAVSFQPERGALRVRSGVALAADRPELRLPAVGAYALAEFEDDGPGVAVELRERIFQPFFTSRVKGMGLGLSIVKGIVEAHRGIVRETGEPGGGAHFVVALPLTESQGGQDGEDTSR